MLLLHAFIYVAHVYAMLSFGLYVQIASMSRHRAPASVLLLLWLYALPKLSHDIVPIPSQA